MKVLIVGSGGREHALAWKISQSPRLRHLFVAPGNAGTALLGENVPISAEDLEGLVEFAASRSIDLTVIGPEAPLAMGIVDRLKERGLKAFGPSREAAMLEASKVVAKQFMKRHGIPTADFRVFEDAKAARAYVMKGTGPVVVKADGLAAGKGVRVCKHREEALEALESLMVQGSLGDAGRRVVIEECLTGPEVSYLAFTDGKRILPMPPARDHKRVYDGNRGPNTGGMGAYTPIPGWTEELESMAFSLVEKSVSAMANQDTPFAGVLYAGLMLTKCGPFVLEYNVRFGDPETQAILPRLRSDLLEILEAAAQGDLGGVCPRWDPRASVCVVAASQGYPGRYEKGKPIRGLDVPLGEDAFVFHAGTSRGPVTSGGRVLAVTALGGDLEDARGKAYEALDKISFDGMMYRRDIGRVE